MRRRWVLGAGCEREAEWLLAGAGHAAATSTHLGCHRRLSPWPPTQQVHRTMVAEEEYKALKVARLNRKLDGGKPDTRERSACLVALAAAAGLPSSQEDPLDERLLVGGGGSSSSSALVGTLDVHAVKALPGEVLIGSSSNAAYLANVCTATAARRRGVGAALLQAARDLALSWGERAGVEGERCAALAPCPGGMPGPLWAPVAHPSAPSTPPHIPTGVEDLYVHTMAVNEIAVAFYERHGFVVEKEESSNQAHYRGRCLDGIEGRGRTLLLRDGRLRG